MLTSQLRSRLINQVMKNDVIYRATLYPQLNASRCFYTQSIRAARLKRFITPVAQFP